MLRCSLLLLGLFPLLLSAAPQQDDLAYAMGARLGERLRGEVPDLPLDQLLLGLRQAYQNEALRLSPEQVERLLAAHEQARINDVDSQRRNAQRRFLVNEKAKPGMHELEGGVLVQELRAGQGRQPDPRSRVRVQYRGELADGSLFDQSEGPQWFRLNSLIKGWQTALREMRVGAKWRVVIPAEQAYGSAGAGDLIPPDAALVFEVELMDVAD
ncbi:FKBP-type peptidyl-prolyl cis-trans isomerase [Pseudomonas sp. PDM14]|uniref:FKBP-type peptidyl-prolyl cis-trans isomerase n=1 Tax=Pseudomonas sp. PDM14 TaxID=2769288 RepID=UPI00177E8AA1|nr:FKBP-type peptidyl-prolyl cis-trans isomerase [Pseudomonas sp. PDM14]MBD9483062.1 FKBP-type peptidyl-prolyl cis-trans isomerase [Pseudomonas sp. PDM14]